MPLSVGGRDRAPGPQGRSPRRGSATCPLLTGRLDGLLQKFRMLMASTSACYKLFREKQKEGHGEAIMFKGECPRGPGSEPGPQGACGRTGPVSALSRTPSSTSGRPAHSKAVGSPWWEGAPASVGLAVVTRTSSRPPPLMIIDLWLCGTWCATLQTSPAPRRVKWFKTEVRSALGDLAFCKRN